MSSSIALRFPLTGLDPLCRKIKYSLTVNSVLVAADTNVIVDRPTDDILRIPTYNSGTNFADADVISIDIKQGIAYEPSPSSGEVTYSSAAVTVGFTISYSVPSQPSAPTVGAGSSVIINESTFDLNAHFTISSINTNATKLYYDYTVVPASGPNQGQTLHFHPYAADNGLTIGSGGSNRTIIIDRVDYSKPATGDNALHKGDVVTVNIAVGVPLGDTIWYFSTTASNNVTLAIPAIGTPPATPGATGTAYGVIA